MHRVIGEAWVLGTRLSSDDCTACIMFMQSRCLYVLIEGRIYRHL